MEEIKISNDSISAIIKTVGAELFQLQSKNSNYIWDCNIDFWDKTSPILFPIVGRLKNDFYSIDNKNYTLQRHGFARNKNFKVIEKSNSEVLFSLTESEDTFAHFPFQFELKLQYVLENSSLILRYSIQNNSKSNMPFSIGAHPAFAINLNENDYSILFSDDNELVAHELENEQFSGKTRNIALQDNVLQLSYSYFEKDAIVLKNLKSRSLTIFENGKPYLKFDLGNFAHLGIWTKPNAPFLCIEPWLGYADSENSTGTIFEKEAIQVLEPKQIFNCYFTIKIL